MDYRNLFGIAAIILSGAVFVHSLKSANAFPQGPNVSMGSNPIDNFHLQNCGSSWPTILTNSSSQAFIITDIVKGVENTGYDLRLRINSQIIYDAHRNHAFQTGLKVLPGETVQCYFSGYPVTLSGYYTH